MPKKPLTTSDDFTKLSKAHAQATIDHVVKLAKGNARLAAGAPTYTVSAQVDVGHSVFTGTIKLSRATYRNRSIGFDGSMGGIGIGGGVSTGSLTLAVQLAQLNNLAGSFLITVAGSTTIQFWDSNHGYVGTFMGTGTLISGIMGGTGTWTVT